MASRDVDPPSFESGSSDGRRRHGRRLVLGVLGLGGMIDSDARVQVILRDTSTWEVSMTYGTEISASPLDNVTVHGDPTHGVLYQCCQGQVRLTTGSRSVSVSSLLFVHV